MSGRSDVTPASALVSQSAQALGKVPTSTPKLSPIKPRKDTGNFPSGRFRISLMSVSMFKDKPLYLSRKLFFFFTLFYTTVLKKKGGKAEAAAGTNRVIYLLLKE